MITIESAAPALAQYLKTQPGPFITDCAERAVALIDHLMDQLGAHAPASVIKVAFLEAGAKLYAWRDAPQGVANYMDIEGGAAPIRVSSDALITARRLLAPYATKGLVFA